MPTRDHETRLKDLRELCSHAEKLRKAADDLVNQLTAELETLHTDAPRPASPPPRRKRRPR